MKMAGGISLTIGLALAGVFYVFPEPLFGLLTNHDEVIEEINIYVGWLFAVLGFGALAFILDAYFLGLTEVVILRNSSLISTLLVFLPMAIASWHWQNPQLLWLALVCFMLSRLIILGLALPKTFSNCSQQRVALVENEGVFRT
jgi:MATE family multidrug resistance protein